MLKTRKANYSTDKFLAKLPTLYIIYKDVLSYKVDKFKMDLRQSETGIPLVWTNKILGNGDYGLIDLHNLHRILDIDISCWTAKRDEAIKIALALNILGTLEDYEDANN